MKQTLTKQKIITTLKKLSNIGLETDDPMEILELISRVMFLPAPADRFWCLEDRVNIVGSFLFPNPRDPLCKALHDTADKNIIIAGDIQFTAGMELWCCAGFNNTVDMKTSVAPYIGLTHPCITSWYKGIAMWATPLANVVNKIHAFK
jgi:hypothetical protein